MSQKSKLIICRLCGQEKIPIKCHIIPKCFFKLPGNEKKPHFIISSKKKDFKKRIPTGVYDEDIICGDCESLFLPWDTYACKFFKSKDFSKIVLREDGQTKECIQTDFDYPRLKLFFMSLLLRANYSKHQFFGKVRLGVHEKKLKNFILSEDPGKSEDFSVVLSNFTDFFEHTSGGFGPFSRRFDGVLAYRFSFGTCQALIKVDQQNFKEPFKGVILSPDKPLLMIPTEFIGSKAHRQIVKDVLEYEKRNYS